MNASLFELLLKLFQRSWLLYIPTDPKDHFYKSDESSTNRVGIVLFYTYRPRLIYRMMKINNAY